MTDHERTPDGAEDVLARLRAADPAATARADLTALRAVVDARRGVEVTHGPGGLLVVDELSARRRARRVAFPAKAVGFAASLLLVGGGGYAVGLGAGGGQDAGLDVVAGQPDAATSTPEIPVPARAPLDEQSVSVLVSPSDVPADGEAFSDDGAGYEGMGGGPLGFWEHTVFNAGPGLSTEGGTAEVYALAAVEPITEEAVLRYATSFGVLGAVQSDQGFWSVGGTDVTSPSLSLFDSGEVGLSYYNPGADPWTCPSTPEGVCLERDLGEPPGFDEARAEAEALLEQLGRDPAEYSFVAMDGYGLQFTTIDATLSVDGRDLHHRASFTFSGAGLQSAYISLSDLVPLGAYAVISPDEAVARFSDSRFSASWSGPIDTVPGSEMRAEIMGSGGGPFPPTMGVTPGMPVPWPVSQVTLSDAELALTTHYLPDGTVMVVPIYRLFSADGGIWEMIAVADAHLDFSDGR